MPRKRSLESDFFENYMDMDDTNSQSSKNGNPPIQRNAANARERARMRVLSSAFGRLKTKLPNIPPDTKLSKLDTLRLATIYIKQLKGALETGNTPAGCNLTANAYSVAMLQDNVEASSQNGTTITNTMSWPFGFHQQTYSSKQAVMQPSLSSYDFSSNEIQQNANYNFYTIDSMHPDQQRHYFRQQQQKTNNDECDGKYFSAHYNQQSAMNMH